MERETPRLTDTKFWVLCSDCCGHGMVLGPCEGCREVRQRPALREYPVQGSGGGGGGLNIYNAKQRKKNESQS